MPLNLVQRIFNWFYMKIIHIFAIIFISFIPMASHAFYVKGEGGISISPTKLKRQNGYITDKRMGSSPTYLFGVGDNLNEKIRMDVTFSQIISFKYKGDITTKLGQTITQKEKTKVDIGMFNVYWDFLKDKKSSPVLSPFIGFGLGVARIKHKTPFIVSSSTTNARILRERKSSTNLALNLIAGVEMPITKALSAAWSYKYAYLGKVNANTEKVYVGNNASIVPTGTRKYRFDTHNVSLGIKYNF